MRTSWWNESVKFQQGGMENQDGSAVSGRERCDLGLKLLTFLRVDIYLGSVKSLGEKSTAQPECLNIYRDFSQKFIGTLIVLKS